MNTLINISREEIEEILLEKEEEILLLQEELQRRQRRKQKKEIVYDEIVGEKTKEKPSVPQQRLPRERWAPLSRMLPAPKRMIAEELMLNAINSPTWEDLREKIAEKKKENEKELKRALETVLYATELIRLHIRGKF